MSKVSELQKSLYLSDAFRRQVPIQAIVLGESDYGELRAELDDMRTVVEPGPLFHGGIFLNLSGASQMLRCHEVKDHYGPPSFVVFGGQEKK